MKKFLLTSLSCLILCLAIQVQANATALFFTDATYPVTATGADIPDLTKLRKGQSSSINISLLRFSCVEMINFSIKFPIFLC